LGEFNFGSLNPDNIERIEVLRGAGGTLYGSEAVGGVINVLTKRGVGTPQFSLLSEGGNGAAQRHRFSLAGAQGLLGFSGSVSYESVGGFRPVNDDYNNLTASLRLDADLIEHGTLRGFFRYEDANIGLFNNLNYLSRPDPNARDGAERYLFKGEWEHRPVERFTYRLAGSVVHDSETLTDPDAATTGGFAVRSRIPTQITTGEAQATYYAGSVGITTAGVEFKEKEARPQSLNVNFAAPPPLVDQRFSASRSIYSGYIQQQLLLLDERLIGTGGVRVDSDEGFGREVSAAWSVGYLQDWDGTNRHSSRIKGSYAEGFKAPTFNEQFFPGFGNPHLEAETSSEYDAGLTQRLAGEQLMLDYTYFNRRTKNLIRAELTDPVNFRFTAENVGRALVQGHETGVTWQPINDLVLRGSYTYLDFHVVDTLGMPGTLPRRPHNRMASSARYQHTGIARADDAIDLRADVSYVGDRADFSPTRGRLINNANYYVVGTAATYSFAVSGTWLRRVALYARAGNLFDRNYEEVLGFKSPPIHFVAGTTLTF